MSARRCAMCGRRLKREALAGIGSVCARKRAQSPQEPRTGAPGSRASPARSQALRGAPAPPMDGQTELTLVNLQPTLWSL